MSWQPIETAMAHSPDDEPHLVLLATVEHGPAIGVVYLRRDGTKRGMVSGYHGIRWTHWAPLLARPEAS